MRRTVILNGRKIEYELTRKDVKNINLHIKKDGGIYVSANKFVGESTIERFMSENADKILENLDRFQSIKALNEAKKQDKSKIYLLGKERNVKIKISQKDSVYLCEDDVIVEKKPDSDAEKLLDAFRLNLIKQIILDMCEEEYPDFAMYTKGFPTVKFRKMTSRNGSCQPKKNILTFNTELVAVPVECIRFVVVHEFCHFIHPNHSKAFHDELDRRLKDNRKLKEILDRTVF